MWYDFNETYETTIYQRVNGVNVSNSRFLDISLLANLYSNFDV